jgi:hypothetical protein
MFVLISQSTLQKRKFEAHEQRLALEELPVEVHCERDFHLHQA